MTDNHSGDFAVLLERIEKRRGGLGAFDENFFQMSPWGDAPGMPGREETQGPT